MHPFRSNMLGILTLIAMLHLHLTQAQYDDEPTGRKLNLEDLEDEQQQRRQLQQLALVLPSSSSRVTNKYFTHVIRRPTQRVNQQRDDDEVGNATHTFIATRAPLRAFYAQRHYRPETVRITEPAETSALSGIEYNHIAGATNTHTGGGVDGDDDVGADELSNLQQSFVRYSNDLPLLQPIGSSVATAANTAGVYNFKQTPSAAYELVSPLPQGRGSSAAHSEANAIVMKTYHRQHRQQHQQQSDNSHHQHHQQFQQLRQQQLQQVQQQQLQQLQQQQQQQQHQHQQPSYDFDPSSLPDATLHYVDAGVQYLTSNALREAPTNTIDYDGKPAPDYGLPSRAKSSHERPQSNQLAYAPQRAESGTLTAPTLPYPPSFISITTHRPPLSAKDVDGDVSITLQEHAGVPDAQSGLVPDFFTHRQPKSLLDSYIPSWVVDKLLKQQQENFSASSNQLATPLYKRHTKRESFGKRMRTTK